MGSRLKNYSRLASSVRNKRDYVAEYDEDSIDYLVEMSEALPASIKSILADELLSNAKEMNEVVVYGTTTDVEKDIGEITGYNLVYAESKPCSTYLRCTFRNQLKLFLVAPLDLTGVKSLRGAFQYCRSLSFPVKLNNTSGLKSMYGTFDGCNCIRVQDMSDCDFSSLTNLSNAFKNCISLHSVIFPEKLDKVTSLANIF